MAKRRGSASSSSSSTSFSFSPSRGWIYFNVGAERGSRHIPHSDDPGRVARRAYTYLHLLIVTGIVLTAVGDEFLLAHPTGRVEPSVALSVLGGPAIYLAGNLLFKQTTTGRWPLSHVVGLALLAVAAVLSPIANPLALGFAATTVLIVVAVLEVRFRHRGRAPARSS